MVLIERRGGGGNQVKKGDLGLQLADAEKTAKENGDFISFS